MKTSKIQESW